ncbi:MAG: hypothetical protein HXS44_10555 [Theionarchaea archaeon]|nr:hypothetical protein [Theionarchaea archaeon]
MKKVWAMLLVAVLVLCPVAMVHTITEAAYKTQGDGVPFDSEGEDGTSPDGIGGNDPEHPQ